MWIVVVTFVAFFIAVTLFVSAITASSSKEAKKTLSRLESIAAPQSDAAKDDMLALRRVERFSAVPWLDRLLRRVNLSDRLRLILYQAGLQRTVARLLPAAGLLAVVFGYLVYLRTGVFFLSFAIGIGAGWAPYLY